MRCIAALVLALAAVAVVGCGHGEVAPAPAPASAPPPAAAPIPAPAPVPGSTAGAPLDRATVVCEHAVRCGIIGASQLAECKAPARRLTLVWGSPDLLGIDKLVAADHLRRAPGGEQRCLAQLASASCRDPSTGSTCGIGFQPVTANVAPGGACTRWDECIDGFCTSQAGCTGTCIARSKLGGTCGANQLCTEDAFCWEGTCRKRGIAGEPCGGHWQWCGDGLFCAGYRPASESRHHMSREVLGTCRAPLGVGESCLGDQDARDAHCRTGLYCAWGDAAPTCQQPLPAGAACRWLDACADGLACIGLQLHGIAQGHAHFAVSRPGTCGPRLDAGSPCDPAAFVSGCPDAMRCDRTTKRCRSRGHAGDPCVSSWITKPQPPDEPIDNDGCFSGHYCDVATRTCKKQLAVGAPCTPQTFGVEDEPCFLAKCDAKSRRCATDCK